MIALIIYHSKEGVITPVEKDCLMRAKRQLKGILNLWKGNQAESRGEVVRRRKREEQEGGH